jgi:hypothetical protein
MPMTVGTNTAETRSTVRWMGARERWASATMLTMRASMVSRPTALARTRSVPVELMGAADGVVPGILRDGHGLARDEGLVDGGLSVFDEPVDGDLLARAHTEQVTDLDLVKSDFLVGAVVADAAGGCG